VCARVARKSFGIEVGAVTVCIFTGPTLTAAEAKRVLDAVYLPPAAHGDVYRATLRQPPPRIIGIIDGYFHSAPAVRHKEILWAMAQGIHVFGAASIGALRAADLASYGMVGVGAIFESFHAGLLEDDDEVAVSHAPAGLDFFAVSEAMVDIRATMAAALGFDIVSTGLHDAVITSAKRRHFAQRSYAEVLRDVERTGGKGEEIKALRTWLPNGRVLQKREDALLMLAAIRKFLMVDPPPMRPNYHFERTETWERDRAFATPIVVASDEQVAELRREDLLDELRLRPELYREMRHAALTRALALREAGRQGIDVGEDEVTAAIQAWTVERCRHMGPGVGERAASDLSDAEFRAFIADEVRQQRLTEMAEPLIEARMFDAMRAAGCLPSLIARALEKQRRISVQGAPEAGFGRDISPFELLAWFVEQKLRQPLPADVHTFALSLGFLDTASFYRAVLREYHYEQEGGRPLVEGI
jgi:hypothetical protein